MVCDRNAVPLAAHLTPGQDHESKNVEATLNAVRLRRRRRPLCLAGDKGYSYRRVREWLRLHRIGAVIPHRDDERRKMKGPPPPFDKAAYRQRNVIERCVGWLKECRRLATRFEKKAVNFLGMVKLAMISRCLRLGLSDSA